jgi:hypothetical protein
LKFEKQENSKKVVDTSDSNRFFKISKNGVVKNPKFQK